MVAAHNFHGSVSPALGASRQVRDLEVAEGRTDPVLQQQVINRKKEENLTKVMFTRLVGGALVFLALIGTAITVILWSQPCSGSIDCIGNSTDAIIGGSISGTLFVFGLLVLLVGECVFSTVKAERENEKAMMELAQRIKTERLEQRNADREAKKLERSERKEEKRQSKLMKESTQKTQNLSASRPRRYSVGAPSTVRTPTATPLYFNSYVNSSQNAYATAPVFGQQSYTTYTVTTRPAPAVTVPVATTSTVYTTTTARGGGSSQLVYGNASSRPYVVV